MSLSGEDGHCPGLGDGLRASGMGQENDLTLVSLDGESITPGRCMRWRGRGKSAGGLRAEETNLPFEAEDLTNRVRI